MSRSTMETEGRWLVENRNVGVQHKSTTVHSTCFKYESDSKAFQRVRSYGVYDSNKKRKNVTPLTSGCSFYHCCPQKVLFRCPSRVDIFMISPNTKDKKVGHRQIAINIRPWCWYLYAQDGKASLSGTSRLLFLRSKAIRREVGNTLNFSIILILVVRVL
jgi:hypothetical protein